MGGGKSKNSNYILLIISYGLYLSYSPPALLVLLCITFASYLFARINKNKSIKIFVIGYVLTLLPLLIFKYSSFVIDNLNYLFNCIGLPLSNSRFSLVVPLGISFYTFQALGYLFDTYKGRINIEKNIPNYMLFIAFFPQIASGPISKASELLPQIHANRGFNTDMISSGFKTLIWGYFLKAVLADRLAIYVDEVYVNYTHLSGIDCLLGAILYSLQIYGDFAGYSLMAIGVGRIFGFELINNFRRPYFSTSVTDFWRRWHISLSRWLKDYVYIPLGGSRNGKFRTYLNIIITFLISGLWHGANWTFIVWGGIHGLVQSIEKFFNLNKSDKQGVYKAASIILTFMIVSFAWIFFRMPNLTSAYDFIIRIITNSAGSFVDCDHTQMALMLFAILIFSFKEICEELNMKSLPFAQSKYIVIRWVTYISLICMILLCGVLDSSQFIYVNF